MSLTLGWLWNISIYTTCAIKQEYEERQHWVCANCLLHSLCVTQRYQRWGKALHYLAPSSFNRQCINLVILTINMQMFILIVKNPTVFNIIPLLRFSPNSYYSITTVSWSEITDNQKTNKYSGNKKLNIYI